MKKERQLTDLQKAFLEALFGEAKGDPVEAKKIAGYAQTISTTEIIRSLKDEIIEQAKLVLALNSPRAAMELVGMMINPNQEAGTNKLKAIESILNRASVTEKESSSDINLKVPQGGLFILPPKKSQIIRVSEDGASFDAKEVLDSLPDEEETENEV